MNRTATLAAASLAVAALLPAGAIAATPKDGSYRSGVVQKGVKGSFVSVGVTGRTTVSGVGFSLACKGEKALNQGSLFDGLDDVGTLKKGAFKATRKTAVTIADLSDPTPEIEQGTAKVTVTGRVVSATRVSGTISAKLPGCKTGAVAYTATFQGGPQGA